MKCQVLLFLSPPGRQQVEQKVVTSPACCVGSSFQSELFYRFGGFALKDLGIFVHVKTFYSVIDVSPAIQALIYGGMQPNSL